MTYEIVTPCALTRLEGLTRAGMPTWRYVGLSHTKWASVIKLHRLLWHNSHVHQSCHSRWCDSVAPTRLAQLALTWNVTWPFFLPSLLSFPPLSSLVPEVIPRCCSHRRHWPASSGDHSPQKVVLLIPEGSSPPLFNCVDLVLITCIALYRVYEF
jgi:hypothetical protein